MGPKSSPVPKPMWGPYGSHIQPIWVAHMGPTWSPVAKPMWGPDGAFMNERYKHGIETSHHHHWNINFLPHAKQRDGTSCGVYVIQFVENYLAGKSLKFTWTKKDVAEKRKYIGSLLAARSVTDLNSTDEQVADWQRDNADNGQEIISPEEDTNSNNEGVERMSSFYYPQNRPLKKTKTDVLCVCEHPNEGNNWHCDICKQQFHHGCFKKDVVHTDGGVSICPNCDKELQKVMKHLQDIVKCEKSVWSGNDRLPINEAIQGELVQSYRDKGFAHFAEFVLNRCEGLKELSANNSGIMATLQHMCKKLLKLQIEIARGMLEEQIRQQTGNEWKKKMSRELQSEVQYNLNQYKESPRCNSSRILTCQHVFLTSLGSFIHRTLSCLVAALSLQRALVMDAKDPKFIPTNWESYMNLKHRQQWPCSMSNSMVINNEKDIATYASFQELTMHAKGHSITNPMEIPNHLASKLFSFNKHPSAWWIGVMAEYIMLGNDKLSRIFQDAVQTMPFTSPVVGVHVRRTDKIGTEAKFHALEEYMRHVADWYSAYEAVHGRVERKVYLASDNVEVLSEAEQKFVKIQIDPLSIWV
ncbi:alpha-(1,6)-fucosyltransferase-like [Mya arenaria]|uniref:alpha-(1,6)-fucosyltransferase-like n=1 Tax=Mya arenaria TaxID=6604 RepID=UPI0022E93C1A|nr:alpha-(1,6)-fucosyltransferase-like [Mya arenaria]